ncbi:hypothetical protein H5410_057296 [Solanum commersonii]|uniref:Retrotransposon Copia-like N-terminal domain-containing protein n=1 Tax=Solanum commersonii TaxID=4109 RepID=A0A9J5WNM7_SOLCO|nr:hypothetical protein H5410_057296 [Solanum commersonii]
MGETSSSSLIPSLSTVSPAPNLAHQLFVKLTSSNFLLWKTQFMPMIYACGLINHIDGPSYRPFTRSLESRQERINFESVYGLLLNEERQLKRDEALTVIAPTTQYTQSSFSTTRGCGRGRGRGRISNQDLQSSQNRGSHDSIHTNSAPPQASDMSGIIYHNCEVVSFVLAPVLV